MRSIELSAICAITIFGAIVLSNSKSVSFKNSLNSVENESLSWIKQLQLLHDDLNSCSLENKWNCFRVSTLQLMDGIMMAKRVPLWRGVQLVHLEKENFINSASRYNYSEVKKQQRSFQLELHEDFVKDLQHSTWFDGLALRLSTMLTTHMLQINLKEVTDNIMSTLEKEQNSTTDFNGTARSRRHRHNMMITMMFGIIAFSAVVVPIGFQFLSVVSGKALLLAKMALLLASINGLKKVASSGVHYGLYHVPNEHLAGYYDRGDAHHPRTVPSVAISEPMDLSI